MNGALGAGVLNYPAAYDRVGGVLVATIMQIVSLENFDSATNFSF